MTPPASSPLRWEEEKSEQLELFCKIFNQGEFKAEEQESALAELNERVTEVYTVILGENQANISTLQMLASLESHIEDMFGYLETVPADRLHAAEKVSRCRMTNSGKERAMWLLVTSWWLVTWRYVHSSS